MRFQPPFLFVALIAVFVSPSVRGQQPTVTLRPSNAVSDPNTPSVRVIADQQRVPLGTLVNFSLSPSSIAGDRQYVVTLYFGDGRQQVMTQAATTHLYRAVGTYTYSVAVKRAAALPPRVDLNASPLPAQTGQAIRFIAQPSGPYPNLQYRFDYGDGTQSRWQASPAADHAYALPGKYSAYVDIGDGTQRIGGSLRKQIPVNSTARSVSLNATPLLAQAKRPVIFTAKVSPNIVNATYQFTFGDGEPPVFQTSPQVQHIYRNSGSYRAFVQVSQTGGPPNTAVQSGPVVLNVQPASTTGPGTSLTPTTRATPTPPSSATLTPTSTPPSSATPTPTPSPVGSPSRDSSPTSSDSSTPNIAGPLSSGSPSSASGDSANQNNRGVTSIRWWYWLFAGVLLLLLFKATAYLFAAKPTFSAFSDPGVAAIGNQKGLLPLDFQLLLNPNVSAGDYSVTSETPLVTNTERLENRQVLEI